MTISRRNWIQGGLAAAAGAALGGGALGRVLADPITAPGPARRLVIVYARGGWDTTYSIDPKPDVATIDGAPGVVRRFRDLEVHTAAARPNVATFFERWGERTAVVHGVEVRSFVHRDCEKRILTGTPSDSAPDVGALAAECLGADRPIPYLVLGAAARAGSLEAISGRVGTTNQLLALTDPRQAYADYLGNPDVLPMGEETRVLDRFREASEARFLAARGQRLTTRQRVQELLGARGRAAQLTDFVREAGFSERALVTDPTTQLAVGIEALRRELSQAVFVEVSSFDTHENNNQQNALQNLLFGALDGLLTGLEDAGLDEDTTVLVVSEMGRTPLLNPQGGKDHWPIASAMVLGAGVRGGRAIGRTTDTFQSVSLDLTTGEEGAAGAARIQTANLVAGTLELVGVDPSLAFPGVQPLRAFHG